MVSSKTSSSRNAKKTTMMKKNQTVAKKIMARYARLRARLLRRKREKAVGEKPFERGNENLREERQNENSVRAIVLREEPRDLPEPESEPVGAANLGEAPQANINHGSSQAIRFFGRNIRLPRSPFLPFPVLLPLLAYVLPSDDMRRIHFFYRHFREGNITRRALIDRIRLYAGDDLLRRIIETFSPSRLQIQQRLREYQRCQSRR